MKKVLFTAKVDSHIQHFHLPFLKMFKDNGYEVHVASEGTTIFENCDYKYNVVFGKNPLSKRVLENYHKLKKIISENDFDIIHTHTAIASVITRLAAKSINKKKDKKSRVIYTAHGFQFLKKGSKKDWILYFPVEFILSKITDTLLLINQEDFDLAQKYKMGRERIKINGVGVNLEKFDSDYHRIANSDPVISYIAELNENKNQFLLIDAFEKSLIQFPKLKLQLIGTGEKEKELKEIVKIRGLSESIDFLGYRSDIKSILEKTTLVVATSRREGLPINIIESMSMAKPIIVTKCRGHVDLIQNGINGFVTNYDSLEISNKIDQLLLDEKLMEKIGTEAKKDSFKYDVEQIKNTMREIYRLDV